MRSVWGTSLSLLGVALASTFVAAQSASPPQGAAEQPSAPLQKTAEQPQSPIGPPGFTYNPQGRRDPFVSLLRRGTGTSGRTVSARPAGLAGLDVADVTLRGTVRSHEGFVAILQGADQKTYIVRAGDILFDGRVRTISQNDLVILQRADDPRSLDKPREVRKMLRQAEEN